MADQSDHAHQQAAPLASASADERRITYFAATHTRGKREMFGIRAADRGKHMYIIGKTGMGKSTMLENMAIQDIQNGEGLAFIDPHGATAEKLLDFIPYERINDVVYFAPFDTEYPVGFNVMENVGYDKRHLVVSGLMGALKRIWVDAWSARMEYILQNTLLALLEYPHSTLLDVNRMFSNKAFRAAVVEKVSDPIVKAFWTDEFAAFTDTYTREATPAIQNKIGQFTSNPLIRNIVGQPQSSFDVRKIMDEKKILIVNLSKGRMGETNASLLGSMLTVKIYLAAMSRADESSARMARLPRFYFYVDEFQSMMNEAFADILSESRKYKLALTLANQYIEQMDEKVRDAVFGNVGTLVVFRVGPFDAEVLKTVFEPTFTAEDLVGLGIGHIYLTLMIDGVGSPPFSAETIPPIDAPSISYKNDVITRSRERYSTVRAKVESSIAQRQQAFVQPPRPEKKNDGEGKQFGSGEKPLRERRQEKLPDERYPSHSPSSTARTSAAAHESYTALHNSHSTHTSESLHSSLKDAILAARMSGQQREDFSRSPLDTLREKHALRFEGTSPAASRMRHSRDAYAPPFRVSESSPRQSEQRIEQKTHHVSAFNPQQTPRPSPRPVAEPPVQKPAESGVSPDLVRRILKHDETE